MFFSVTPCLLCVGSDSFFGWVAYFFFDLHGLFHGLLWFRDRRPARVLDMPQALQQRMTLTAVYMVTEYRDQSEIKRQKRVGWKDCMHNQLQF